MTSLCQLSPQRGHWTDEAEVPALPVARPHTLQPPNLGPVPESRPTNNFLRLTCAHQAGQGWRRVTAGVQWGHFKTVQSVLEILGHSLHLGLAGLRQHFLPSSVCTSSLHPHLHALRLCTRTSTAVRVETVVSPSGEQHMQLMQPRRPRPSRGSAHAPGAAPSHVPACR